MENISQGQVLLSKLIFTLNWEDPHSDEAAMQIQKGQTIFTITSGGCNTLGFLRFEPANIYCVDINAAQTYLMELKQAAFRELDYNLLLGFFGLREEKKRIEIYRFLKKHLSDEARLFWDQNAKSIQKGIVMQGRYEKFVRLAGRLLRLMQGNGKTKQFFQLSTMTEQKEFYSTRWDNARWRWVFKTMFNKKRLAKKGLNTDYFHFDDGSSSFSESFYRRAGHVMTDISAQGNYFLSLYFLGHYLNNNALPDYLKEENFEVIKKNIDNIHPITADSKYWLEKQPSAMFDAMSLSNICELMDENDTHKFFAEVARTAKPGARIIFRNLMIPRDVPADLRQKIVKDESLSKSLQSSDRSFVYSKVAAYSVQ